MIRIESIFDGEIESNNVPHQFFFEFALDVIFGAAPVL